MRSSAQSMRMLVEQLAFLHVLLNLTFNCRPKKVAKKGAGRPPTKAKIQRKIVDLQLDDTYSSFQSTVVTAAHEMAKKAGIKLGDIEYDDIEIDGKVPKGSILLRKAVPLDTKSTFLEFRSELFGAADRCGECNIEIGEAESDHDDSDEEVFSAAEDDDAEAEASQTKRKKSGKASVKADPKESAAERLQQQKISTLKEINARWQCDQDGCNLGGHCLVDKEGCHHPMTKTIKERFVYTICQCRVGSVDDPPSFLFDKDIKARGRNGPRPSLNATPQGKGKNKSTGFRDINVVISSPTSMQGASPGRSRSEKGITSSSGQHRLKRTIMEPLTPGDMSLTVDAVGAMMQMHKETLKRLNDARFVRVSALARTYEHNFGVFLDTFKPSPAELSDIEDLLLFWSASSREASTSTSHGMYAVAGPSNSGRSSMYAVQSTSTAVSGGKYSFGPTCADDDLFSQLDYSSPAIPRSLKLDPTSPRSTVKTEPQSQSEDEPALAPVKIGRDDAIVLSDSASSLLGSQDAANTEQGAGGSYAFSRGSEQ
ncbi:hypothetical protein V8E36_002502 [Tilletia maclaganii]